VSITNWSNHFYSLSRPPTTWKMRLCWYALEIPFCYILLGIWDWPAQAAMWRRSKLLSRCVVPPSFFSGRRQVHTVFQFNFKFNFNLKFIFKFNLKFQLKIQIWNSKSNLKLRFKIQSQIKNSNLMFKVKFKIQIFKFKFKLKNQPIQVILSNFQDC
jgi:hypothetical protein